MKGRHTMAKQRKAYVAKADSKFWHPSKVGEKLSGTFDGFSPLRDGFCMNLTTAKGVVPVGVGAMLKRVLKPHAEKFVVGKTKVELSFSGENKSKKGRPVKTYVVKINGKVIESEYEKVAGNKVMALFDAK
jgi:hypothetical protein